MRGDIARGLRHCRDALRVILLVARKTRQYFPSSWEIIAEQ
jgi:hypothetical protein